MGESARLARSRIYGPASKHRRTLTAIWREPERACVIATHLGPSPSESREQVRRILEVVSTDERPTILLGDINEWLVHGRPLRWLHARFGYCKAVRTFPARFRSSLSTKSGCTPSRLWTASSRGIRARAGRRPILCPCAPKSRSAEKAADSRGLGPRHLMCQCFSPRIASSGQLTSARA